MVIKTKMSNYINMEYAVPVGQIYPEGPNSSLEGCSRMFGKCSGMFENFSK